MGAHVRFLVVGDGGRKRALEEAIAARKSSNIELSPPVSRTTLRRLYRAADVLFLHLNDYDAFKRVLPSKIFEYAAMGKPVWAGVAGHAAEFVRSEVRNAAVFPPCSVEDAVRSFDELTLEDTPRPEFLARYARSTISRNMAEDIVRLAAAR
jgi:glycosyltransferase involved in cell wall biosynthesis